MYEPRYIFRPTNQGYSSDHDERLKDRVDEHGSKGGFVEKNAPQNNHEPISLVDFLWQHRDD